MKKTDSGKTRNHCPEVDKLMKGKMPFITRHGITLLVAVLIVIAFILFLSKGAEQQLMKDMIDYTLKQISTKL